MQFEPIKMYIYEYLIPPHLFVLPVYIVNFYMLVKMINYLLLRLYIF